MPHGSRGLQWPRSHPRFERGPCCPGARGARARALPRPRSPGDGAVRAPAAPLAARPRAARAGCGAYVALTKPRIIELLLVTTVPAMMLAARGWPSWRLLLATLVGGTLAAGAANVFNCYFDRDIDRLMHRTAAAAAADGRGHARGRRWSSARARGRRRSRCSPRPRRCSPRRSRRARSSTTPSSTRWCSSGTPGAAPSSAACPGAAPVLIGWAAVTGSLDWPAVVVFGVVFCWQMPHFWALAMRFKDDYARADVPMLPVVATALSVGRQTVAWAWADRRRLAAAVAGRRGLRHRPGLHGGRRGPRRLVRRRGAPPARAASSAGGETKPMQLFHVSISYLALLSVAIVVDAIV